MIKQILFLGFGFCLIGKIFAISWIDLPQEDLATITLIDENIVTRVNSIVNSYHSLAKTEYSSLEPRIKKLCQIKELLNKYLKSTTISNTYKYNVLLSLHDIAANKAEYLQAVAEFYVNGRTDANLQDEFYSANKDTNLLELTARTLYSPKQKSAIGVFWLEAIDPCHRKLKPYWNKWQLLAEPKPLFFLWLEEQVIPYNYPKVYYPTVNDLHNKHCFSCDHNYSNRYFSNATGEFLFVVMPDQHIYAITATDETHHTSLSYGRPVVGAGNFKLQQGKVVEIFLNSGHYLPNMEDYTRTLQAFFTHNIAIDSVVPIKYYINDNVQQVALDEFRKNLG